MRRQRAWSLVGAMLALTGGTAASAVEPPTHECAAVPDPLQRLSCYDTAFPPRPRQSANAPAAAAPAATAPAALPPEEFGFTDAERRQRDATRQKTEAAPPQEIRATVSTMKKNRDGKFVASLDNGQVWAQTELDSKARLKPGDTVVIHKASLGSYLLVTPYGIGTRVRRLE